jgi:hypothetical protein
LWVAIADGKTDAPAFEQVIEAGKALKLSICCATLLLFRGVLNVFSVAVTWGWKPVSNKPVVLADGSSKVRLIPRPPHMVGWMPCDGEVRPAHCAEARAHPPLLTLDSKQALKRLVARGALKPAGEKVACKVVLVFSASSLLPRIKKKYGKKKDSS